jgi:aromatic ring-opening dioxygenase catalytic subunit (LigB family)
MLQNEFDAMNDRMPAIFFGHGNPLNALLRNQYTGAWSSIGDSLPRPKAVLCVSAHWYLPGTAVTAMETPRTIHDFGGFPPELYEVKYPAPGDPEFVHRLLSQSPRPRLNQLLFFLAPPPLCDFCSNESSQLSLFFAMIAIDAVQPGIDLEA